MEKFYAEKECRACSRWPTKWRVEKTWTCDAHLKDTRHAERGKEMIKTGRLRAGGRRRKCLPLNNVQQEDVRRAAVYGKDMSRQASTAEKYM